MYVNGHILSIVWKIEMLLSEEVCWFDFVPYHVWIMLEGMGHVNELTQNNHNHSLNFYLHLMYWLFVLSLKRSKINLLITGWGTEAEVTKHISYGHYYALMLLYFCWNWDSSLKIILYTFSMGHCFSFSLLYVVVDSFSIQLLDWFYFINLYWVWFCDNKSSSLKDYNRAVNSHI